MKNLFKPLFALAFAAVALTSCNKSDNTDYEAEYLKEEKRLDSIFTADNAKIQRYIAETSSDPGTYQEDSVKVRFHYLDKTIKRGIYFKVLSQPTDDTYEYKATSTQSLTAPKLKLKYTATLLDGTVVQSDTEGSTYSFNESQPKIFNQAWYFSFFPYAVKFNGQDVKISGLGGLTKNGLKKGSKIRVITPSYWAFGGNTNDKIPANSPLVYEFEVLTIE
ncbi:FKBP-type peptidyl-prolyl cis-trans isomerase [Sphingobacterium psychroaquaticum]|uniref:Peptidyl-prolyl cis-trans isomerase n=1 Tax=Sphingobacterium psychroaquaticum TaxID=561061 RepID=A0A1X7K188_9SPHI|nr:FKBP-type peptidyl-prolyl cis-trans isomerase [Sphingobacterium psychroaquaticum]QBQ42553.1 hypothetical protein E2P86_15965 [Sphingobacterium psychroaquaticum]SMG34647.1 FKBP-type peptidyl-prolyl cis-trans isomerase [Sphingobacterium psychroaquaticum]